MRNGKRLNFTESGIYDSLRSSFRKLNSNESPDDDFYEFPNQEVGRDDKASITHTWSLNQSSSCPDIFQRLAAGKRSPVESGEVDPKQLQTVPSQPGRSDSGVLLRHRFCPWDGTEFRHADTCCPQCGSKRTRSSYTGKQEHLATLLLPPWERVLWKPQPYDDNYVPRCFLDSLVRPDPAWPYHEISAGSTLHSLARMQAPIVVRISPRPRHEAVDQRARAQQRSDAHPLRECAKVSGRALPGPAASRGRVPPRPTPAATATRTRSPRPRRPAAPRRPGTPARPPRARTGANGWGEQVKNANVVHYDLWQIVTDSFAVSQAIHPPSPKPSPPLPAHAPPCADPDGPGRPEGRVDTARGGHDRRQRQGAAGRRRPEPVPPRPPSPSFALPSCLLSSPSLPPTLSLPFYLSLGRA